jgi:hypothetical protein
LKKGKLRYIQYTTSKKFNGEDILYERRKKKRKASRRMLKYLKNYISPSHWSTMTVSNYMQETEERLSQEINGAYNPENKLRKSGIFKLYLTISQDERNQGYLNAGNDIILANLPRFVYC